MLMASILLGIEVLGSDCSITEFGVLRASDYESILQRLRLEGSEKSDS